MQVDIQGAKRPIVEKGIGSTKNFTEDICETSLCSVLSTNLVEPYIWLSSSETPFLYKMQVDIQGAKRPMMEKGLPSNKNYTEEICETSYGCVL